MRKEYGEALRETFEREMRAKLPKFAPFKAPSQYTFPGERVYRWKVGAELHCFIVLVPGRSGGDEFSVEIGWSSEGRFPELGMRPSGSPSPDQAEFDQSEFVCRLSGLWTHEDFWWQLTDYDLMDPESQMRYILASGKPLSAGEARKAVEPRVRDVIDKISKLGLPYLEELVRSKKGRS